MKKIILFTLFIVFTTSVIFSEAQYKLGQIKMKRGTLDITYVKDGSRDFIKMIVKENLASLSLYLPTDLSNIRAYIDKYHQWYKIATENKSVLNKTIGNLNTFRVDFQTNNGSYEIAFVETRTGLVNALFDPAQINAFKEIISDQNIDNLLNEEKRKKEKEDQLFK